jgi:transcriptional regulator with XRE-family HTH domain
MKDSEVMAKIGARIKKLREEHGMSQQEFAAKLDYEKSNASRMESGKVNLRLLTLAKVAKVFNMTLSDLMKIE